MIGGCGPHRVIGQKRPFLPGHVWWSIRVRVEVAGNKRDLALFNMAVDSKLWGCDLVCLRVRDVFAAGHVETARIYRRGSMPATSGAG